VSKNATPEQRSKYSKRYRERNYERVLERERNRRSTPEGRARQKEYYDKCQSKPSHRMQRLISKARRRAIDKGLPYSEELFSRLKANPPMVCVCCDVLFDYTLSKGHNSRSASFDRIDNTLGYTLGNVAVICRRCNRLKGDATPEEIDLIAAYVRNSGLRCVA
jgi:hypothetical protein